MASPSRAASKARRFGLLPFGAPPHGQSRLGDGRLRCGDHLGAWHSFVTKMGRGGNGNVSSGRHPPRSGKDPERGEGAMRRVLGRRDQVAGVALAWGWVWAWGVTAGAAGA